MSDELARHPQTTHGPGRSVPFRDLRTFVRSWTWAKAQKTWKDRPEMWRVKKGIERVGYFRQLTRRSQVVLSRLRMGHIMLTHGFILQSDGSWLRSSQLCSCGENRTIEHILETCEELSLLRGISMSLLSGNFWEVKKLLSFLKEAGLYHRI